jgi:hypothetical protein
MKRIMVLVLLLVMIVFCISTAWGAAVGLGTRAIGMGGAYTAVADDEFAPYWNPAGITNTKHVELSSGLGFQGDFQKLINIADKISNKELPDKADFNQNYFMEGYLGLTTKYFALSGYTDSQLITKVEANNDISAGLQSNNYGLLTIAGYIGENWAIGINLKNSIIGNGSVSIPYLDPNSYDTSNPADIQKLKDYKETVSYYSGTGTACDLGMLYKLSPQLNLGFTARNIFAQVTANTGKEVTYGLDENEIILHNNFSLKQTGSKDITGAITLPKSYILGIAYRPYQSTLLAADAETITDSANSSDNQTRIHLGFEQKTLWNSVALRLGYFTGNSSGYTAGLGLKLWVFNTNLAYVSAEGKEYVLSGSIKF